MSASSAALTPKRWPVRWRLAAVSADPDAGHPGDLRRGRRAADVEPAAGRLQRRAARHRGAILAAQVQIDPRHHVHSARRSSRPARRPDRDDAVVENGRPIRVDAIGALPHLGAPTPGRSTSVGDSDGGLAAGAATTTRSTSTRSIVQYARSTDEPRRDDQPAVAVPRGAASWAAPCSRRWPGSRSPGARCGRSPTLTATAREIASTRDPSLRIPEPETDDEVGELARTLEQMLRELDAARSETEQMMQAQREFVADASHELRTPLTSILANLELLQERLEAAERRGEEGEMIESALRSSRRMSRLVSDLLLLARADAGRTGARRECDLAAVAAAAALRGAPGRRRPPPDAGRRRAGAGRRQPGRAPPAGRQPARQRPAPHPRGHRDPGGGRAPQRRRGARGLRRRPRASRPAWRSRSSPGSFAATAPPTCAGDSGTGPGPRDREGGRDLPRRRGRRRLLARRRGAVHGAAAAAGTQGPSWPPVARKDLAARKF